MVLFLPLPNSVICTLEIQARDAQPVYVDVTGQLVSLDVVPGQQVAAGQQLAQLRSIDTDLQVAKLEGDIKAYRTRLDSLMQQSFRDYRAADQIPQVQEALNAAEDQLKEKHRDQQRLRLVAPVAGMVLPPPLTTHHEPTDEKLPAWSGTPLDPENLGATLEQGVLFCQVGDPKRLEAVLVVDQADRNMMREGQSVDLKLEGFPSTTWHSEIKEIAESELKVTPQRLSTQHGGELPSKMDPHTGVEKADEHVVPGPGADGRSRGAGAAGRPRPGPRLHRLAPAGHAPLAAGGPHVQLQDVGGWWVTGGE